MNIQETILYGNKLDKSFILFNVICIKQAGFDISLIKQKSSILRDSFALKLIIIHSIISQSKSIKANK